MPDQLSGIERLAVDAWQHFAALAEAPFVVRPAVPIVFFGDSQQYRRSARKIITVGLNPSLHEFPSDAPFRRFAGGAALYRDGLEPDQARSYVELLDRYFRDEPYTRWFRCFEPILNGLEASYYGGWPSTALNTDLCSPLATQPTWSGLSAAQQALLIPAGVAIWHRLVEALEPDVILISVARRLLDLLRFELLTPWQPILTIERRKDGSRKRRAALIEAATIRLRSGKTAQVVFGRAAHTPFGLISDADKIAIGARIAALLVERPDRARPTIYL